MKECKVLHIHDGGAVTLQNGDRHLYEQYPWAEEVLTDFINQGYEVKQMIPQFSPAMQREGCWSFYKSGFIAYLEREVPSK